MSKKLKTTTSYIIIGIMLLFILIQYATNPGQLLGLLISAPGVLIAITFHEFAHGYAAYKLGYKKNINGKRRSNSLTCWTINELYTSNNIYANILCNI